MKKNLTTPAGQTDTHSASNDAYVNAINQVFAILRRNYHNQYYKALPDEKELSITKRLWLDSLKRFDPQTILIAAKSVIESSEFMPTLRTMIRHCEEQHHQDLPDAHRAYIEACRAPSPKAHYNWTHPAIYFAGRACDWYFLQSSSESIAFPIFKKEYEEVCKQVLKGVTFDIPKQLENDSERMGETLDKNTKLARLENLKKQLKL